MDSNIYTFTGNILIAINPFASLPGVYGPTVMERYRDVGLHDLPPHIYATVASAYRQMLSEKKGQAILVCRWRARGGRFHCCYHMPGA